MVQTPAESYQILQKWYMLLPYLAFSNEKDKNKDNPHRVASMERRKYLLRKYPAECDEKSGSIVATAGTHSTLGNNSTHHKISVCVCLMYSSIRSATCNRSYVNLY